MKKILLFASIVFIIISCDNSTEPTKEPTSIDELVKFAGYLSNQSFEYSKTELGNKTETTTDGINEYISNSKQYKLTNKFDEIAVFSSSYADVLFPGSLIQGKDLIDGKLTPIINKNRTPITLVLQGGSSQVVTNPSNSTITQGIRDILKKDNPKVANMTYNKTELFTGDQAFLDLGLNINWLPGSLSAKFQKSSDFKKNSIFLYFKQVYYTISIDNFAKPSELFDTTVTVNDLKPSIFKGNPPCIISSVSYGRIIMVKITSEESLQDMTASIEASLSSIGSGYAKFDKSEFKINSSFDAVIIGGTAQGAAEAITNTSNLDDINKLIQKEAVFSYDNPGYPIAYTVRYIDNFSPVLIGKTTDFSVPNWMKDPSQFQTFDIYLSHFNIIDDGNGWGIDGKFYYEIVITDKNGELLVDGAGNETVFSRERYEYIEASDGERINLTMAAKGLVLRKKEGEQFTIKVKLYDYFSSGNDELAGSQGLIFEYPWNYSSDFVTEPLACPSGDYKTEFVYRIEKK